MGNDQILPLPVVADNMRPRDQVKPQERLDPRSEASPKPQIFRTVRGVRPAEKRRSNATCTSDVISNNLQLSQKFFLDKAVIDT